MRITNGMMQQTFMSDLSNNLQRLYKYQMQQSTNKRIQRLSDDPVGVIQGLQARERLYRLEQYQRNIGDANRWLNDAETALREMNDVIKDSYELTIDAATDVKTPEDRAAMAPKIKAMLDHLLSLGNTTTNDESMFGGFNTTSKPFVYDEATDKWLYNGDDIATYDKAAIDADAAGNTLRFEVGYSMKVDVTLTGPQVMVYDSAPGAAKDMLNLLQNLYDDLNDPTKTGGDFKDYIGELQSAQDHLNALAADFGGRSNRMDMLEMRYSQEEIMYTEIKSNIEDVDMAEAIMNFAMASSVYNASLQAGAKVIQPTLMDYLR